MYKKEDFKVGQTLWRVNTQSRIGAGGYAVTITKVGHKFLTVSMHVGGYTERVEIERIAVDGGQYIHISPAQCYLSEQHYITHKELSEANSKFLNKIRNIYRPNYSLEVIAQVEKLLEI